MKRWRITGVLVLLLVTNMYSVLVGKYEYFPYRQISALKQKIISVLQVDYFYKLERDSPKVQEARLAAEAQESRRKDQYEVVSDVVTRIQKVIYESAPVAPDFEVTLPAPSAYVMQRSVPVGTPLQVYVHAPDGAVVELFRLGAEKTSVGKLPAIKPMKQSARYSPVTGLGWKANYSIPTTGLRSGYYLLELESGGGNGFFQMPFIVRPRMAPEIAFVASTNSWQAFNDFAGKNFYGDRQMSGELAVRKGALNDILSSLGMPQLPVHLPTARLMLPERPITDASPESAHYSHLLRAEWNLVAFAERNKIDYGVYTDDDLEAGGQLLDAKIMVIGAHSEYWSQEMIDAYRRFVDRGGKVILAGGNAAFKLVEKNANGIDMLDNVAPALAASLTGTYTSDVANPFYAPYKVMDASHWVFAGTQLSKGDLFGTKSLNHREEASMQGVSGWEADQMGVGSDGFHLLATGTNIRGPAHMVFRDTPAGGWIFNASAIPFSGALFVDPVIGRIMLNLLHGGPSPGAKGPSGL
jgi:hypothetical protein